MVKTHDDFVKELSAINPEIEVIGKYTRAVDRIDVQCKKCGLQWHPQAYRLTQGIGCPECGKRLAVENRKGKTARKTTEQFVQELNSVNSNISIVGEYAGSKNRISCSCNVCGYNWAAILYLLLKGSGCPNCTKIERENYRLYTPDSYKEKLLQVNPSVELLSNFTKSTEIIEVKCIRCGHIWSPKAFTLLQGKGCPKCSQKIRAQNNHGKTGRKTSDSFRKELSKINNSIEVIGEYINTHTNISCKCKRCNYTWDAKPYSLLQGHGCPRCAKSGTSFMEQFILLSFQKAVGKDKVLSRDKGLIGMELDIYIPDLHIAIEPGNWFLHKKSIKRDRRKRELCSQKQVDLITIYDKYPNAKDPPFDTDCITFSDDYNKADHSNIKKLVRQLFTRTNLECSFSDDEWSEIETEAYDNALSKTHNDFVSELKEISPTIHVIGGYQNANKRLLVKCMTCGYKWNAVPANLLRGDGCRKCGSKVAHETFIKTQEDFVKEVEIVNPTVEVVGNYNGRHNPVKARCKICGFVWEPRASSLLRGSSHKGSITMHKNL